MKKHILRKAAVICALSLSLTGCNIRKAPEESEIETWLRNARLDAEETPEQLYQAALKENTLIVYSASTRIYQTKKSFEEEYPGLTVEIYDMRAYDMVAALKEGFERRKYECDIVVVSEGTGSLTRELLPEHIINTYMPADIEKNLRPDSRAELLYFMAECQQLFYNSEVYESCPVSNWWELTEPEWYGRIYMNSPLRSHPSYAMLHSAINQSDAMAAAYEERYGEPLTDALEGNAGKEFYKRLLQNGIHLTTSSNELLELVGASGQEKPPLAFMISSKIRRNAIGYKTEPAYNIIPIDGIYVPNSVSIAGGAQNVNSAKLFIRWLAGEADGTGEGLKPYLTDGSWSTRTDVKTDARVALEDGNFWYNDVDEMYEQQEEITDFWLRILKEYKVTD